MVVAESPKFFVGVQISLGPNALMVKWIIIPDFDSGVLSSSLSKSKCAYSSMDRTLAF